MYYYEYTDHKKIYNHSYWGHFGKSIDMNDNHRKPEPEIIQNRNKFIKEYDIVKYVDKRTKYVLNEYEFNNGRIDHIFDHLEFYKTNDNKYILVSSPYGMNKEKELTYYNMGWLKIYPLYSFDAVTFIKIVSK